MKNLIEFILIHLVDHPEDVSIDETKNDQETTYLIHVHDDDIGRVIGKGGSVIQAIRQIARVRATKEGERIRIDIHTEDRPARSETVTEVAPAENQSEMVEEVDADESAEVTE